MDFTKLAEILVWPVAIIIIVLVFFLVFRRAITAVIGNVKKVGKDGVTIDQPEPPQPDVRENGRDAVQELVNQVTRSEMLDEAKESIEQFLESQNLPTESNKVEVLVAHLATTQILLEFERIHLFIFGSQITLLKNLNSVAGVGRTKGFLQEFYEAIKTQFPTAFSNWTLDQYLQYLINQLLIRVDGDRFQITIKGVEFLIWMARFGRDENKAA